MNKKGDIQSILTILFLLFVVGILFLFVNHFTNDLFGKFNTFFENSPSYNNTDAHVALQKIVSVDNQAYDYAYLGLLFGSMMALAFTAYATRISPIFFWVYMILAIVVVALSVMLSNMWQQIADDPTFAVTITHFPIMNMLLGTYYPTFGIVITAIVMIFLFGKPAGAGI